MDTTPPAQTAIPEDKKPASQNSETVAVPRPGSQDRDLGFLQPASRPDSLGRLGHYEVLEVLGQGGFGIVFRAFDDVLQRIVAVKVLAPEVAASTADRKRFLREARSAAQVRHENVVQIYAVEEQPLPFLVMEFVPGETLQQRLDRTGRFAVAEVAAISRQTAEGLAAAHAVGLVHRDIKPGNILVEEGSRLRVKITDFGLARSAGDAGDAGVTQSGAVLGTPLYMSPEQARGDTLDHRTDLFSLGSLLYTITCGQPPFQPGKMLAVLRRVAEEEPRPVDQIVPETPAWLSALIAKLMAKDPNQRFQTAAEVIAALDTRASATDTVAFAGRGPSRRKLARTLVLAGVTVSALVVVALFMAGVLRTGNGVRDTTGAGGETGALARSVPTPEQLAARTVASDSLRREDISPRALAEAGRGLPDGAPQEIVAILGRRVRTDIGSWSPGGVRDVAVSPDGDVLASCLDRRPDICIWKLATGQISHILPTGPVYCLAFSPDGKILASGPQGQGQVMLWDWKSGRPIDVIPETTHVSQLAFSRNGRFLAICPDFGEARLYEIATKKLGAVGRTQDGGAVAFSPDGKVLAFGGSDGILRLSDVNSGAQLATLGRREDVIRWAGFHPNGRSIAFCGTLKDSSIWFWDIAPPRERPALRRHTAGGVLTCAWRADGKLLVSAGLQDGTLRLWEPDADPPRSRAIILFPPWYEFLQRIAMTPEGRHVVTGNPDGTIYVLRLAKVGEVYRVPTTPEDNWDRAAAFWVLSLGGTVEVNTRDGTIGQEGDLPREPFNLLAVDLTGKAVRDAGLARLKHCRYLKTLRLGSTQISDSGLIHLKDHMGLNSLRLEKTRVTNDGLGSLAGCARLMHLYLDVTEVSDAGLTHLKHLKQLSAIGLSQTAVTDAGTDHLSKCPRLARVWLGDTALTDEGLARLETIRNLEVLSVIRTRVTQQGLAKFRAAVPGCWID